MTGNLWRGVWYIYNHRTREFLRSASRAAPGRTVNAPGGRYARWTPGIAKAQAYKNPSLAQKMASLLNGETDDKSIRVITVVTGEAARCLDLINKRDRANTF